jgi:glyoxylase-like metal-dependent hydrolase (beta-lactamase superfamily II)
MEILPSVHGIQSIFLDRLLTVYLLIGRRVLLVDSGIATTPEKIILPYLDRLGISVKDVEWLVITHASGDHFGGNHAIKSASPNTKILAHELDKKSISNHQMMIDEHINLFREFGVPFPEIKSDDLNFLSIHGPEVAVDQAVFGGEQLTLDEEWTVTLLHTPGHTPGHLMVYDPMHQALLAGDGIMGMGVPDLDGNLIMPPCYFEVDWYLNTIESIKQLSPQYIFGSHYQPISGVDVDKFIMDSEAFLSRFNELIHDALESAKEPLDIPTIINEVRDCYGIPDSDYQYGMSIRAHLRKLFSVGKLVRIGELPPHRWMLPD